MTRRAACCRRYGQASCALLSRRLGSLGFLQVLLVPMLKPRSYTREDVVELHCHGGSVCVQRVLSLCLVRRRT